MRKKIITGVLALFLVGAMIPATALADDIDDTQQAIDDIEDKQAQNADDQQAVQEQKDEVDAQIVQIQDELKELNTEIDAKQGEVDAKQKEVDAKQEEINLKKKEIEDQKAAIGDREDGIASRLRIMYKNGSVGFFDILLNSRDLSEFLSNLSMVQRIYESDQNTLAELQKEYEALQKKLNELEDAKDELTAVQGALQEEQSALETKQGEAEALEGKLQEKAGELQAKLEEFQAQADALAAELAAQQALYEEQLAAQRAAQQAAAEPVPVDEDGDGVVDYYEEPDPNVVTGSVSFIWPTQGIITSRFGGRDQIAGISIDTTYHGALDIANAQGTPIYAACGGVVTATMDYSPWGNYITIYHGDGFSTAYWHLMDGGIAVAEGQYVEQGQLIGYMGMTGYATGPHLHFEVRVDGVAVDPELYLP